MVDEKDDNTDEDDEHISTSESMGASVINNNDNIHPTTSSQTWYCQVCGAPFSTYEAYQIHFRSSHS
jgi:hypothetical protein